MRYSSFGVIHLLRKYQGIYELCAVIKLNVNKDGSELSRGEKFGVFIVRTPKCSCQEPSGGLLRT